MAFRYFFPLLLMLLSQHLAQAQEKDLRYAPEANVKKITEWITLLNANEKIKSTHKRMTYHYRKDGQPDTIIGSDFQKHHSRCEYYNNGKLAKVYSSSEQDSIFIRYTYHNDREIEDIHILGQNAVSRKVTYFNANQQIAEIKEFEKGGSIGNAFRLVYRTLFNYNKQDSLFAETHYHYMLYTDKSPSSQSKIIHEYDADTGKRTHSMEYNFEDQLTEEINYAYDLKNRLIKKTWNYPGKPLRKERVLKYKNGKLWQDDLFNGFHRRVKVYKDGRYIRKKEFSPSGKLAYYIDFQYEFY